MIIFHFGLLHLVKNVEVVALLFFVDYRVVLLGYLLEPKVVFLLNRRRVRVTIGPTISHAIGVVSSARVVRSSVERVRSECSFGQCTLPEIVK